MFEKIALLATLGVGVAGGYFLPRSPAPEPASPGTTEVTLSRSGDGHFYANAEVNGKSVRFLVDTGASAVALSEKDAAAVGIKVDPSEFEYFGDGAAGMVRGKEVRLSKMSVDGIAEDNVDAVVVANGDVSLLGMPFLNRLDEVIIRKSEMTFRKAS